MKKLLFLIAIAVVPHFLSAQSCSPQSCDKTSCGPEGTKKGEAAVIKSMRAELESVISKMSKSTISFDKQVSGMTIQSGSNDDESLLFLSQAIASIHFEMLHKLELSKQIASLRDYRPMTFSTKHQMVSALKKEIEILSSQAAKL